MKKIAQQLREFFTGARSNEAVEQVFSMQPQLGEKFQSLDSFIFMWKNSLKKLTVHTDVDVSFSNYFTFGNDVSYIRRFIGKPAYAMNNEEFNIIILLYEVNIKGHSVNFELHFHDHKLFCINYTYNYLTRQERSEILQSLEEKYHVNRTDLHEHLIVDNSGNSILVEEKDKLSINYFAPNNNVRHLADSFHVNSRKAV
jgi:hypothetical protein